MIDVVCKEGTGLQALNITKNGTCQHFLKDFVRCFRTPIWKNVF